MRPTTAAAPIPGALDPLRGTGNSAGWTGGGGERQLTDCTLGDNLATYEGGGGWNSSLERCVLAGDAADFRAGGAWNSILNDCVLTGNSASTLAAGRPSAH